VIIKHIIPYQAASNKHHYFTPSVLRSSPSFQSRRDSSGFYDWRFAPISMEYQWKEKIIKGIKRIIGTFYRSFTSYSSVFSNISFQFGIWG
jgi:hypothetical protein